MPLPGKIRRMIDEKEREFYFVLYCANPYSDPHCYDRRTKAPLGSAMGEYSAVSGPSGPFNREDHCHYQKENADRGTDFSGSRHFRLSHRDNGLAVFKVIPLHSAYISLFCAGIERTSFAIRLIIVRYTISVTRNHLARADVC